MEILQSVARIGTLERVSLVLTAIFLILSVVGFIKMKIHRTIFYLTGLKKKKGIRKLKREWMKTRVRTLLLFLLAGGVFFSAPLLAHAGGKETCAAGGIVLYPMGGQEETEDGICYDTGVYGVVSLDEAWTEEGEVVLTAVPLDDVAGRTAAGSGSIDEKGNVVLSDWTIREREDSRGDEQEDSRGDEREDSRELCFSFQGQGRWRLEYEYTDPAEEKVTKQKSDAFLIDARAPVLSVHYENITGISDCVSDPVNVNRRINRNVKTIVSPDCEVFAKQNGLVRITVDEDYFDAGQVRLYVYEMDYDTGEKKEVTKEYYDGPEDWEETRKGHQLQISWNRDGHYRICIEYTDAAGHSLTAEGGSETASCLTEGSYEGPAYTVDTVPPRLKGFRYGCEPERVWGSRRYFVSAPDLILEVEEENFNQGDFRFLDVLTWADGSLMGPTVTEKDVTILWTSSYVDGIRVNTGQMRINTEANHTFSGQVTDAGKNKSESQTGECTYDTTAPRLTLHYDAYRRFVPYRFYRYFSFETIPVRITATDKISGVQAISFYFTDAEGNIVSSKKEKNPKENVRQDDLAVFEILALPGTDDFKGSIHAAAENFCGLASPRVDGSGMVSESEEKHGAASRIAITLSKADYTDEKRKVKYYRHPLTARITVTDAHSGIAQVTRKAKTTREKGGDPAVRTKSAVRSFAEEKDITYTDTAVLKIKGTDFPESSRRCPVKIRGLLTDNAGNQSKKTYREYKVVVDSTKPVIAVKYNITHEDQNPYYNQTRVATVTVRDYNFNPRSVRWSVSGSNRDWEIGSWTGSAPVYRCKVRFPHDGEDYKIKLAVSDYAGNRSVWDEDTAFTIDKTPPVIAMEFSRDDAQNGMYFSTAKTVVFHIREKHLNPKNGVVYTAQEGAARQAVQAVRPEKRKKKQIYPRDLRPISAIAAGEEAYVASVTLDDDGVYAVNFRCTDLAGNVSNELKALRFTIDKTAPVLSVSGLEAGQVFTGELHPAACVTDKNINPETVTAVAERTDGGGGKQAVIRSELVSSSRDKADELRFRWADFPREKKADGLYVLKVYAKDLAGNEISLGEGIPFSVNRFGISYRWGDRLRAVLETGYMREEEDLTLTETNVNALHTSIVLLKDNETETEPETLVRDLSETTEGKKGWCVREYTLKKENFTEEGTYQITVHSQGYGMKDGEEVPVHETTNELNRQPVGFIVDKTPPTVQIGGLDQEYYEEDSHSIIITAMDNYAFDHMDLRIHYTDGRKADTVIPVTEGDLGENHTVVKTLDAYNGRQEISYEVWDKAGNHKNSAQTGENLSCVITKNQVVQTCYRKPWVFPAVGLAAIAIVLLLIFAVWRRKRRTPDTDRY